jgi:HK97 family phage prohead protease
MTDFTALRAEAARTRAAGLAGQERAALPGGEARREDVKFATEFRAEKVQKDGRDMFLVEGYASTTERAYEMWDFFGPYEEVVSRSAFDQTLAAKPLVVYRFNHAGTPMASTRNGRLELWNDSMGLGDRAWLNPERDDVQLLMHAVEDGDVGEQSMMFQIEEGVWNDDYTEFRIDRVNLDRGDVGPVTYGANPHTMVAARSGELLAAIPSLPPIVAREAYTLLGQRSDITPQPRTDVTVAIDNAAVARATTKPPAEPSRSRGVSLALASAQLEVDKQYSK